MDGQSLTPDRVKLEQLRELFPEVFSEGKIDWEKLKATLGEDITFSNERYVLNWAGKSDAFKILQAPSTKTLIPVKDESVNFDETENIFIEGENLEVLKVLQKSYFGKIKMIYIDPPYNTGNDSFIYPDKFSETKEEYQKRVGDKDEEGYMTKDGMFRKNSKENGQYHSNWLNMMYPRLFLAKNLLKEDGVIFVSIDDNEDHNLRLLMNEIFGEENFVTALIWEKKKKGAFLSGTFTNVKEYVLVYSKSANDFKGLIGEINDDLGTYPCVNESNKREIRTIPAGIQSKYKEKNYKLPKGSTISAGSMDLILHSDLEIVEGKLHSELIIEGNWRYNQEAMEEYAEAQELYITEDLYLRRIVTHPRLKKLKDILYKEGKSNINDPFFIKEDIKDLFLTGWGTNEDAKEEIKSLTGVKNLMDYPKPAKLIAKLTASIREEDFIVLDFFSGSCTTAQSIIELNKLDNGNRKFICVQLPEITEEKSNAYKAGYKTIADIAKERVRRVIAKINEEKEALGKETANLMEKVTELQQQIEELQKKENPKLFAESKQSPEIEKLIKQQEVARDKANENIEKMDKIDQCDKGFKVLKLSDSNFKQWQQIEGKDAKALEEQMKLFVDPVAENATIENMVYELLLKSGKDLNCKIEDNDGYFLINGNEIALLLERVSQELITEVMSEYPKKVIALDKLFAGNDQLKTNTVLQMKDAGIEFKTI